jgi:hypothetical protein
MKTTTKRDEVFDAGKLMRSIADLHRKLDFLYAHLPCLAKDTPSDCPFARHRTDPTELMDAGEESHSALTEPISFHARGLSYRGPAFVAIALALLGVAGAFGWFLIFHRQPLH